MLSQEELLQRIRDLEAENSELQDKLDMIYSILAPDYEPQVFEGEETEEPEDSPAGLINIKGFGAGKPS